MRLCPPVIALAAIALLAACGEAPSQPGAAPRQTEVAQVARGVANLSQSYISGSTPVTAYGPIYPATVDANWSTTVCVASPAFGLNAAWGVGSPAISGLAHDWLGYYFTAGWISAWGTPGSKPVSLGTDGHSWTKYTTEVAGNGSFVIKLLADNCSWIYLDGTLVGVQPAGHTLANTQYGLTLNGSHTLSFIIFDGGGLAGGKFLLETTSTPPAPLDSDGDTHPNLSDAFPFDPAEWADADGDGHGDNGDAFPADGSEWVDTDHDGVGDNSDAFPLDPLRWLLTVPTTTTVSFGAGPFTYTGSAFTATATVNEPTLTASIDYAGDCINAGSSCTATATFAGDATHDGSVSTPAQITITKAPSTTTVSFGAGPFVFKGSAFTATAASTAATSLIGGPAIAYTGDCTNGGIACTATATYGGDINHNGSNATAKITITYAVCAASGHAGDDDDEHGDDRGGDASRGHESGSTLPVKLRVCDAQGRNISSRSLPVKAVSVSPTGSLNDSGKANPGFLFRLDDGKYMFNLSTKGLVAGNYTLNYTIGNDPTIYRYAFIIRAEKSKGKDDDKNKGKSGKKP